MSTRFVGSSNALPAWQQLSPTTFERSYAMSYLGGRGRRVNSKELIGCVWRVGGK